MPCLPNAVAGRHINDSLTPATRPRQERFKSKEAEGATGCNYLADGSRQFPGNYGCDEERDHPKAQLSHFLLD